MATEDVTFEDVLERAEKLPLPDRARLIAQLATTMKFELAATQSQPRTQLFGRFAHFGPAPSAEEIDEVRREMWANFPREDI